MRFITRATAWALVLLTGSCFAAEGKKEADDGFFGGFEDATKIVINAADAKKVVAPMRMREDPKAAKGKYLDTPDSPPGGKKIKGGHAEFEFDVKEEGKYYLHVRVWWPDACGNTLLAFVDGKRKTVTSPTTKHWRWVKVEHLFRLGAGKHKLKVANGEDGARFDQVLLTTDKRYVAVDIEE